MPTIIKSNNLQKSTKNRSRISKKSKTSKNQSGGEKEHINTSISYPTGSKDSYNLKCSLCKETKFKVQTLTMGTKAKDFFGMTILDNRFKVFTCKHCGHVDIFSNNIKCNTKECDPIF